ncbi:MAG TPA: ABC transporter permease [Candidatus Angelobacter sp.]|nr:ABC transporter permease [Candidatus Angelobacter sp.]
MKSLLQDLRYGWRTLSRSPGFSLVAVLTLALGIGANSTIFSWINATLLTPLPGAADTRGLVSLTRGVTFNDFAFSYPDLQDLRKSNKSFSGLMAFNTLPVSLTGLGKPERIWSTEASANYFDVLGVRPIRGRTFLPAEDEKPGGAPVVVISYGFWQAHFGGRESAVGQIININRHPYTIVGIAPPLFQGAQTGLRSELWIPLMMEEQLMQVDLINNREADWLLLYGRLRPGVDAQAAQEEMTLLMQQIARDYPDSHRRYNGVTLYSLWRTPLGANGAGRLYVLLPMLLALAGVVLLLACANVANLLLVRSVARRRELAIRLSLGAGRWRLIRQLLVESFLLALAGGAAASLITTWSSGTFNRFLPPTNLPVMLNIPVNRTVLVATMLLAVLTSLIFGILPALRSSRLTPIEVLKEESGSSSGTLRKARLSSVLVVAQISLSLLLLICAGLFLRSFQKTQKFNPGFNPDNVLLATFELFPAGYSNADGAQLQRRLVSKLETLPGMQSVSLATWLPLGFTWSSVIAQPEGYVPQEHESMEMGSSTVGPNYLRTMQIPLLAGREFTAQDTDKTQRVVIVNQTFVDRYWRQQNVLGKKVKIYGHPFSVIGVAKDSNYSHLNEAPQPFVYLALFQDYAPTAVIHARVAGDPARFAATIDKAVHELAPDLPLFDVFSLQSRVQSASMLSRIASTLVGAFGTIALILSAVGLYAVIAYTTRQRVREIGIRMAIGAQASDIRGLIMGQGLRLILFGLTAGLAFSLLVTRFLRNLLFGVPSTDLPTFAAVGVLLCVVALAACYIPARRAMKIEPVIALRYQ